MKPRNKSTSRLLIVILTLFCVTTIAVKAQDNEPRLVPLFTLLDYEGNEVSLEKLRGNVVMINFWATWCPPCVEEMPTMQALKESLIDKPFEILAVNMGEDEATIKEFVKRIDIDFSFPLLVDLTTQVATDYEVSGLPATLIIDKPGYFAFGGIGPRDWNSAEVHNEILPLLEE